MVAIFPLDGLAMLICMASHTQCFLSSQFFPLNIRYGQTLVAQLYANDYDKEGYEGSSDRLTIDSETDTDVYIGHSGASVARPHESTNGKGKDKEHHHQEEEPEPEVPVTGFKDD